MFKSVEESIKLFKEGVKCDTSFSYVYNAEEVDFDGNGEYEFNINGDSDKQIRHIRAYSSMTIAHNGQEPYDEFTQIICPAYQESK